MTAQEWKHEAKCVNLSVPEIIATFDVGRGKSANRARRFCSSCPVRKDCLNYALVNGDRGIWAGTTEAERDAMGMIREMLIQDAVSFHRYSDDWRIALPEPTQESVEVIATFINVVIINEGIDVTDTDRTILSDLASDDEFAFLQDPECVRRYA